ncbi:hypothetical protein F4803DRAFT_524830 [Xylaria telfairii]|nr:hypothetical protein F4803DRAFT_524830 [Xylaria telfairii]
MTIPVPISPSQTEKDAIPSTDKRNRGQGLDTTTDPMIREITSSSQNAWSWHGGHNSWPWGGIPTTVLTLTTTVPYTQSFSTPGASQSSSPSPTASETGKNGVNISGPVAAGIGAGASVGLLGIGIVVYLCIKYYSRRRGLRSSKEQESDHVEASSTSFWPPYPFSASNESPVELSAIRQPQEMCAKTRPQEKDSSNRLESVGLDGRVAATSRSKSIVYIELGGYHRFDTSDGYGVLSSSITSIES